VRIGRLGMDRLEIGVEVREGTTGTMRGGELVTTGSKEAGFVGEKEVKIGNDGSEALLGED